MTTVRRTLPRDDIGVGATDLMEGMLPAGRADNELEIIAREPSRELVIRTDA